MKKLLIALTSAALFHSATAQDAKIEITGNDQMQYSIKAFEVTEGQKVVLSFKHIGQLPVIAMGHNVIILAADTAVPAFATKCASDTDLRHRVTQRMHSRYVVPKHLVIFPKRVDPVEDTKFVLIGMNTMAQSSEVSEAITSAPLAKSSPTRVETICGRRRQVKQNTISPSSQVPHGFDLRNKALKEA